MIFNFLEETVDNHWQHDIKCFQAARTHNISITFPTEYDRDSDISYNMRTWHSRSRNRIGIVQVQMDGSPKRGVEMDIQVTLQNWSLYIQRSVRTWTGPRILDLSIAVEVTLRKWHLWISCHTNRERDQKHAEQIHSLRTLALIDHAVRAIRVFCYRVENATCVPDCQPRQHQPIFNTYRGAPGANIDFLPIEDSTTSSDVTKSASRWPQSHAKSCTTYYFYVVTAKHPGTAATSAVIPGTTVS